LIRHLHVHHDQVGREALGECNRLLAAARAAGDVELGERMQVVAQRVEEVAAVVDQEQTGGCEG
jgi:hypothetical protein